MGRTLSPGGLLALVVGCAVLSYSAGMVGASSAGPERPPPVTVATVDLVKVIDALNESKDRNKTITEFRAQGQKELDDAAKEFEAKQSKLQAMAAGPEQRALQNEMTQLLASIQARKATLERELSRQIGEAYLQTYQMAVAAAARMAERDGYDILLCDDRTAGKIPELAAASKPDSVMTAHIVSRRVLMAAQSVDLSDKLIALLNDEYKAGGRR